jgi:hypothetical protein
MNLNEVAKEVSKLEGGKVNLQISQIKEVLHCLGHVLMQLPFDESTAVLAAVIKRASKGKK